ADPNLTKVCGGDPIGGYDPLGLRPPQPSQNVIQAFQSGEKETPAFQFAGDWTDPSTYLKLEVNDFQMTGIAIVNAPLMACRIYFLPGEQLANQYIANYQITGSESDALVMTLDPMWLVMSGVEERRSGLGLNADNYGQVLTEGQKTASGFRIAFGTVQTALIAVPAGKFLAGTTGGRTAALMLEGTPYTQARQVAALSRYLETAPIINAPNSASVVSGLNAAERATRLRVETQEGIELIANPKKYAQPDAWWRIDPSTVADVDFMGQPRAYKFWDTQRANFMKQIDTHLAKYHFVVIDLTGATESQVMEILMKVSTLSTREQGAIIFTGW
ncbi:MAG: hypothetical protein WCP86_12245, partial [bacterium]